MRRFPVLCRDKVGDNNGHAASALFWKWYDVRAITAELLGKICHLLLGRNESLSHLAQCAVKIEAHGNDWVEFISNYTIVTLYKWSKCLSKVCLTAPG